LLVDLARGKTVDEAYAIGEAEVEAQLDGYPEKKKDYPSRSIAALRAALDDYRAKRAAGAITERMLAEARTSSSPLDPVASESPEVAEAVVAGGIVTIKLH
jgi:hypothetical protein